MDKKEAIERVDRLCTILVPFYGTMSLDAEEEKQGDYELVEYLKRVIPDDE